MNLKTILLGSALITAVALGTIGCTQYKEKTSGSLNTSIKTEFSDNPNPTPSEPKANPVYVNKYNKAKHLIDEGKPMEAVYVIEEIPLTTPKPFDQFVASSSYGDHTKPQPKFWNMEGMSYVEAIEVYLEGKQTQGKEYVKSMKLLREFLKDGEKAKKTNS